MRSAITQRASVPPPPPRRATAAQPSSTRANTATTVSRSAAAVRDPTPASSKWTATCSGVSMLSCCRRVAAGSGRSRAGAFTSPSYRHPAIGASGMADIRPMNFGEILDGALMIYRRHFGLFLKLALVALSVPVVLFVYVGLRAFGDLTNALRTLLYLVPVVIVYYAASLVLTAGTIRIISDSYLGRDPRLHDALALGLSKILPLIAVGLGKAIVLGLIMIGAGVVVGISGAVFKGSGVGVLLVFVLACAALWFTIFVAY